MQGMTGGMLIAVHEAREACKGEPDIEKRIEKAMLAVKDHWMETNKENQFKSAIAAAMMESSEEEKDRIQRSFDGLARVSAFINALQAGVPVDFDKMAEEKQPDDILPLMPMWRKIAA